MSAQIQFLDTPDGVFGIIAAADGAVMASGWTDDADRLRGRIPRAVRPDALRDADLAATDAVRAFYAGDEGSIRVVPVRQEGTPLQRRGWDALREIPAGEILAYREFADRLGNSRAVRAAASICARNAAALFVPCHRVARTDGTLGGFAWGIQVKEALLAREGAFVGVR